VHSLFTPSVNSPVTYSFRDFNNGAISPEFAKEIVQNSPFYQNLANSLGNTELMYVYPTQGALVCNLIMCEDPNIRRRFMSLKGNFNTRLKQFIKEE
jgi:hypothetical protein